MKLHWGTGIALAVGLFILVTLVLAGIAMTKDVDLVTDRYYEKGIRYEDRIASMKRAAALATPVQVSVQQGILVVKFPENGAGGSPEGSITLYRPSNKWEDRSVTIALDSLRVQRIPIAQCAPGLWRVQIAWRVGKESYYAEDPVMLL